MSLRELSEIGATILLANAYHLYLRPGIEVVAHAGGLHRFMGWEGPLLTDSGGYQIFSLKHLCTVTEEGVVFRSHLDGSTHRWRPEEVVAVQEALGVDIAMVLDECPPGSASRLEVERSCARTTRWAQRARATKRREDQALFAIVQGGVFPDLRVESAQALVSLGFSGYGVGGLSVGEEKALTYELAAHTVRFLPEESPRYLMGVGTPADLVQYVSLGFDLFDCVLPTRNGRNGTLFTAKGKINIRRAAYTTDLGPVEDGCTCYTCHNFSRAYLRHLAVAGEMLSASLNTLHNLHFYLLLMQRMRKAIAQGTFADFAREFLYGYADQKEGIWQG
jgi:queuine tRNA-ribosyltransferase